MHPGGRAHLLRRREGGATGRPRPDGGGHKKGRSGKAGILYGQHEPSGITFHDIRRTVKTNMVNAGVDQVHRNIMLGHSLHGMDVHYMAPSEDDLDMAMRKYTECLDSQILQSVDHIVCQVKDSE